MFHKDYILIKGTLTKLSYHMLEGLGISRDWLHKIIWSACFLKSELLVNFWIQRYSNIFNLLNISMMLNKGIIWGFWVCVTISSLIFFKLRPIPPTKLIGWILYFEFVGHCATNLGPEELLQLLQRHAEPIQCRRQVVAD